MSLQLGHASLISESKSTCEVHWRSWLNATYETYEFIWNYQSMNWSSYAEPRSLWYREVWIMESEAILDMRRSASHFTEGAPISNDQRKQFCCWQKMSCGSTFWMCFSDKGGHSLRSIEPPSPIGGSLERQEPAFIERPEHAGFSYASGQSLVSRAHSGSGGI